MLQSSTFSDVTFIVQNQNFPAHRAILEFQAPVLAALAKDMSPTENCIELGYNDDPEIFKSFLHFVYTNELPDSTDIQRDGRNLLDIANKFECIYMKLFLEMEILSLGLTVGNATDLLLYAKSKNCALLQEAATKFICENMSAVMATDGWNDIKKSCLHHEMLEMALNMQHGNTLDKNDSDDNDLIA